MRCITTKVSLGILIYLSSSLWGSQSSLAVSLQIGNQTKNTILKQKLDFSGNFVSNYDGLENGFSSRENTSVLLNPNLETNQKISKLFVLNKQQLSSLYSKEEIPILSPDILLSQNTLLDIETSIESDPIENTSLLGYITNSLSNLEFATESNDSASEYSVTVLTQSSIQDIYEGVYSFEVDLSGSNPDVLEALDNSATANSTLPRESRANTSDLADESNISSFSYLPYKSNFLPRNSSSSSLIGDSNIDSLIKSLADLTSSENLFSQIGAVIPRSVNVFTNVPEIQSQTNYNFSRSSMSGIKKDPKMREIERKIKEERRQQKEQRKRLQQKLEREQEQREQRRRQRQQQIERERKERLQRQTRKQQEIMRRR